ncbi:MAG: DUF5009 domain-containing protein, partial [bacterium]
MSDSLDHSLINLPQRIESIDVLRGITILVMLFVNDIAGVRGLPSWMKHVSANIDGMTFVDVVFPAFLFIVGMAIPFAIGRRFESGQTLWQIWRHILIRSLGLLIIGVIMVNSDSVSGEGIINPDLWILLAYAAIILIWNQPPKTKNVFLSRLRIAGMILLITLVFLYRGNEATGIVQLRTKWWGILGLIGWAYLITCIIYIPLRKNIAGLVGAISLLYCIFIADEAGFFSGLPWIKSWINIGSTWGSHSAIVVSGVVLGMILRPDSSVQTHFVRIRWALLYGLGLAAAGILLHSLHDVHKIFIINKILATPPWCLLSSAIMV